MPDALTKSSSKDLESVVFDPDFGGYVVERDRAVPHKSVRPLSQYEATLLNKANLDYPGTLISVNVNNERNTGESRLKTRSYPKNGAGSAPVWPEKTGRRVDRSELARFADKTFSVQSLVPRNTLIGDVNPLTLSWEQDLYAPDLDRKVVTYANAWEGREDVITDPETGLMTKIYSEVVTSLPTLSEQAAGINVTYKEVAAGVWIKETRFALKSDGTVIDPLDAAAFYTFTWTTREKYMMPGYMYAVETSGEFQAFTTVFLPNQRRSAVVFKPPVRFPFEALAEVEYTETFHAAQPAVPGSLFSFAGRDWLHDGNMVNINIKGILQDTTTTEVKPVNGDTFYVGYSELIRTYETQPVSAVEYRGGIIGSLRLVEVTITRGPNKTFRMLQKRVRMQGNVTPSSADVGGIN
jgi:hypothetical protein